jgi:phage terminase large subunit
MVDSIATELGAPTEKQKEFLSATNKYVAYGGCRGGGKAWALKTAAVVLAMSHAGIEILIVSKNYRKMKERIIDPILWLFPKKMYEYIATEGVLTFCNKSRIRFVAASGDCLNTAIRFGGLRFDAVFFYGAENFTETEFRGITHRIIGANDFPKRVYLTWEYSCNPGAEWLKRLFVDRKFKAYESPDDYLFISALPTEPAVEQEG